MLLFVLDIELELELVLLFVLEVELELVLVLVRTRCVERMPSGANEPRALNANEPRAGKGARAGARQAGMLIGLH